VKSWEMRPDEIIIAYWKEILAIEEDSEISKPIRIEVKERKAA
jgi:hypothetical protein